MNKEDIINKKKQIGLVALIDVFGKDYYEEHKHTGCFAYGEDDKGFMCSLYLMEQEPEANGQMILTHDNNWDFYAVCYVKDDFSIEMGECKLPNLKAAI